MTDRGLAHLMGLTQLQYLILEGCVRVTEAGVKKLQQALPNCKIEWKAPTPGERSHPFGSILDTNESTITEDYFVGHSLPASNWFPVRG